MHCEIIWEYIRNFNVLSRRVANELAIRCEDYMSRHLLTPSVCALASSTC